MAAFSCRVEGIPGLMRQYISALTCLVLAAKPDITLLRAADTTTPPAIVIRLPSIDTAFADLMFLSRGALEDLEAQGKVAPGSIVNVARSSVAVAAREGAPKPDISTPDALKQTLLRAQSISTIPASATGTQVSRVFQVLGISEAMNDADDEWGEEGLIQAVREKRGAESKMILEHIVRSADRFVAGAPQYDDMTLIVARVG